MCNLFRSDPHTTLSLKIQLFASNASIAQLGERQTEDLKVPGSIPGGGNFLFLNLVTVRVGLGLEVGFGLDLGLEAGFGLELGLELGFGLELGLELGFGLELVLGLECWG